MIRTKPSSVNRTSPVKKQIEYNRKMDERLVRYDVRKWADDFINNLVSIKKYERELLSRKLTSRLRKKIAADYRKTQHRLILLDYDGTLRNFERNPQDAIPDKEVLRLLIQLSLWPQLLI